MEAIDMREVDSWTKVLPFRYVVTVRKTVRYLSSNRIILISTEKVEVWAINHIAAGEKVARRLGIKPPNWTWYP